MSGCLRAWRGMTCAFVAAAVLLFTAADRASARRQSAYFRVSVTPDYTIYGVVWEDELFLAPTPDNLVSGEPVKAVEVERMDPATGITGAVYRFPEIVLPVPAQALPRKSAQARASLGHSRIVLRDAAGRPVTSSGMHGRLGWAEQDGDGSAWRYWRLAASEAGTHPRTAPALDLPPIGPLALKVSTKELERRTIGIGARLMAGETELHEVTKDGEDALLSLRVYDSAGKEIAADRGNLAKFGFT